MQSVKARSSKQVLPIQIPMIHVLPLFKTVSPRIRHGARLKAPRGTIGQRAINSRHCRLIRTYRAASINRLRRYIVRFVPADNSREISINRTNRAVSEGIEHI